MPEVGPPDEMPPHYNAHNNIILKCTFIDVDNIGGYSWRFVLPLDAVRTWRTLCDKLSTCLSLIRDLEGVPYPVETTFWAKDLVADGFICKEDWEQLVYGGGKYELVFRGNSRIKQPPGAAGPQVQRGLNRTPPGVAVEETPPPQPGFGLGGDMVMVEGVGLSNGGTNGGNGVPNAVDGTSARISMIGNGARQQINPAGIPGMPRFAGGRRVIYPE